MDERLLNDLLECSVCLERLDSSSKVLPCQHTFCRKCLEEIVASHQELRCPECRVLVEVRIDELPPNVLLMRILEGMKTAELNSQNTNHQPSPGNNGKPTCNRNQSQGAAPNAGGGYHHHHQHQQHLHHQQHPSSGGAKMGKSMAHGGTGGSEQGPHQQQHQHQHHHQPLSRIIASNAVTISSATTTTTTAASNAALDLSKIPHAKAFYDFSSSETSDISFRKGDIILLKKKIDHNWCVGEVNGKEGAVPLNHIKVIVPLPFPQCKALYDFRMGPSEEEGCLTFKKGALIHVLRRVDQNWAEGRIAEKIGIFPISFVEMNGLAKHLMDSSLKHLMGNNSNRTVPPTPFDLHASATSSSDTSSSVTTSPNSSTSTTSSNSSTAPSSPTAHFLQSQPSGATTVAPTASKPQSKQQHHRSDPANREKRHSLTTATFGMPNSGGGSAGSASTSVAGSGALQPNQPVAHRHSTEMLNSDTETARHPVPMAMADSPGSSSGNAAAASYQKCNLTKASQMYQAHPQLPTTYVALYPYKPQKPDELELKKGSIYYVTERCQDGWFKGTNWQKKSGVFPGNYVQIYKGREGATSGGRNSNANSSGKLNNVSSPQSGSSAANGGGGASAGAMNNSPNGGSSSPLQLPLQLPELPPRNTNQQQQQQQQGMKYIESIFGRQSSLDVGGGGSPSNDTPQHSTTGSDAATMTPPSSAAPTGKVKKDSSAVSLMKRLTNMKRSKSPTGCSGGTANPAYTSDGSLFEETAGNGGGGKSSPSGSPASGAGPIAKPNFQQIVNPVHVRSGSCPSQLLQNLPMDLMMNGGGGGHGSHQQQQQQAAQHHQQNPAFPSGMGRGENAPLMYGSQRIKPHKERPSMQGFKYGADHSVVTAMPKHIAHEAPASTSSSHMAAKQQTQIYHRKSQSLDASAIISQLGPSQHPNAQPASNGTPSKSSSSKSSHSQSVRERFKCIVPYPPNSEYELELRVGDIVMVHKKRDNGWYKGTHARSGKTGLFPASFVEPVDT